MSCSKQLTQLQCHNCRTRPNNVRRTPRGASWEKIAGFIKMYLFFQKDRTAFITPVVVVINQRFGLSAGRSRFRGDLLRSLAWYPTEFCVNRLEMAENRDIPNATVTWTPNPQELQALEATILQEVKDKFNTDPNILQLLFGDAYYGIPVDAVIELLASDQEEVQERVSWVYVHNPYERQEFTLPERNEGIFGWTTGQDQPLRMIQTNTTAPVPEPAY